MRGRATLPGGFAAILLWAAPANAQTVANWSGLYLGVNAGFARSSNSFDASDLAQAGFTSPLTIQGLGASGAAFGFTGGYNSQTGALVLGLEADWTLATARTDIPFAANIPPFGAVTGTLGTEVDWISSLRLRAGLSLGQALVYGSAGFAIASARGELYVQTGGGAVDWVDSTLLAGFAYGGGIEYALTPNWSVKAEFLHTYLTDNMFSSATANVPVSGRVDIYNLRGGLNFRF